MQLHTGLQDFHASHSHVAREFEDSCGLHSHSLEREQPQRNEITGA